MSVDATRWAWLQRLPATRKIVLLALADRADEESRCRPSVARLAADVGMDRKTVLKALTWLCERGLIEAEKNSGEPSQYRLLGVERREDLAVERRPARSAEAGSARPKLGQTTCTKSGTGQKLTSTNFGTGLGQTTCTNFGTGSASESDQKNDDSLYSIEETQVPVLASSGRKHISGTPVPDPEGGAGGSVLPAGVSRSAWDQWVTYRRERRKTLTASTAKKQLAWLANQPDADSCIEQSIRNGWVGLFELRQESRNGRETIDDIINRNLKKAAGVD